MPDQVPCRVFAAVLSLDWSQVIDDLERPEVPVKTAPHKADAPKGAWGEPCDVGSGVWDYRVAAEGAARQYSHVQVHVLSYSDD